LVAPSANACTNSSAYAADRVSDGSAYACAYGRAHDRPNARADAAGVVLEVRDSWPTAVG
jgi:hypothetical protein